MTFSASLSDRIVECLAGPLSVEISDKTDRIMSFLNEQREKADEPEEVEFEDLVRAIQENEELDPLLDDVMADTWDRLEIKEAGMDEDDWFFIALEQFFDVYLTNQ